MRLRMLSASDVRSLVPMEDAIRIMTSVFAQVSTGKVELPQRTSLPGVGGVTLTMPARLIEEQQTAVKIVSVYPGNRTSGLPVINGVVLVLDDSTGVPVAVIEASYLTALRTGAAAGLATHLLSPPDARVMTIIGAGAQAPLQIEAVRSVRRIEEVRIVSRGRKSAERLADTLDGVLATVWDEANRAVAGAQIVVAATDSTTPVFDGRLLSQGTHVSGVGSFRSDMQEIDEHVVCRARVIVDSREAAWEEAGDLIQLVERGVVGKDVIDAELGDLVTGKADLGSCGKEITFFKSVGMAAQDVGIAAHCVAQATQQDQGTIIEL